MTELRIEEIEMPTADVGGVNPLPPLFGSGNVDKVADLGRAGEEMRANAGYGRIDTVCPHLIQDRYSRERTLRSHPVAVLENDHLRAMFLLNAGGRLWSLVDKDSGSDLLFTNPIFQPANLALRNAWFAGGVEWNIGTIGHTPGTCDPIHAGLVRDDEGEPILRMYEFDRIRRVVYSLDARLRSDSAVLEVAVRIVNPNDSDVPMYWWSNMAVRQTARTRVLAPAADAWNYSYDQILRLVPVSAPGGGDVSYPAAAADAADFFFDIHPDRAPWIAAVDEFGAGVFQASTSLLLGRKLFRWGTGPGGQRWQDWLCGPADGYAEIQAGLAKTQFEHLRMPAGAEWSWVEAYGRIDLSPEVAHGSWQAATGRRRTDLGASGRAPTRDGIGCGATDVRPADRRIVARWYRLGRAGAGGRACGRASRGSTSRARRSPMSPSARRNGTGSMRWRPVNSASRVPPNSRRPCIFIHSGRRSSSTRPGGPRRR